MNKILSFIIALIISLTTYPFSFLPAKNDTAFDVETQGTFTQSAEENAVTFCVNKSTPWFNYYGIRYSSNAYVRGEIAYENGFGKALSETFFLEPGEDALFFSFIDNVLNNKKARNVVSLTVSPLNTEDFNFSLAGVSVFNREVPEKEIFVSNSQYKMGINLDWGGALSYLEDLDSSVEAVEKDGRIFVDSNAAARYGERAVNSHVNLINRHDTGRLVQQSYYGVMDSEVYENGYYTNEWPYNPVQGGNKYNNSSKLVDLRVTDDSIYIKCRPMDWAKDAACICPAYMEATYSFVENALLTSCRFVDYSNYEPRKANQEVPAFYCIEPLNRFVYYGGDKPWTDDALSAEPDLPFWGGPGKLRFTATENWGAFTGEFEDSFGIGLYTGARNTFIPGVYNRGKTALKDPSVDDPTSYFAVIGAWTFRSFEPFEYNFYLTTGTAAEIRNNFKSIAE